ncbi:hypothetical protein [Limnospira platensis]|uniref:hypothetical protein n=1 Tax=Limnospira platensis TaxID=118562 RepID=UPI0001D0EFFB|nr:hypothetical protein [Arthrospira platensis FACHB-971]MDF2207713.1 hypothetical protein [Arthrospira platensis NCB002]MDT9181410.1 hypothetical protein [Limnospira sp. PMC 289.06]MDT9309153.1 hypothetical protein [Limnospira sp. Paracas R14]BAI93028.1 hypothetical protein NIES39_M01910 [Arthrospira platensis NIES-39]
MPICKNTAGNPDYLAVKVILPAKNKIHDARVFEENAPTIFITLDKNHILCIPPKSHK